MVTLLPCLIQPYLLHVPAECMVFVKFQELMAIPFNDLGGMSL